MTLAAAAWQMRESAAAAVVSASRSAGSIASHASAISCGATRNLRGLGEAIELRRIAQQRAVAVAGAHPRRCASPREAPNPAPRRPGFPAPPALPLLRVLLVLWFESVFIVLFRNLALQHNFVQRIFDDARRARSLQPRNHIARHALFHNRVHRDPLRIAQLRNRRRIQRRQHRQHTLQDPRASHSASGPPATAHRSRRAASRRSGRSSAASIDPPAPALPAIRCVSLSITVSMILR